ncbi:MAG: serine-aspartate repeat-containing protein [Solirubrobacteraceae bacterium]|jgi:hypothetical protein|nr:serine-aspartate repeat-containing protein [Solirubrobacteraceae bacterium]
MYGQQSDGSSDRPAPTASARRLRRPRIALLVGLAMLMTLSALASQAQAALPLTPVPTFTTANDENGADDQPGQKDLSLQGVATPAPGDLWTMWQWDVTSLSGGNTGDACSLFDTNNNSKINFAVCVSIGNSPATQLTGSPRVFTCGDGKVDRCTSTYTQITPINTACATNTSATDPFHAGQNDTQAICHIALADVGGAGSAKLVNTCSYPSMSPTSDPSDCVLIPRDAFVTIQKIASPNAGTFPFRLGTDTPSANPVVFTASGSQTSAPIAIRSGVAINLKEDVPTNWAIDTPTPVCSGASGSGTSNGAFSGDTITGIKAASDNTITCVFRDKQLAGAITITKQRSGTTVKLNGAHFSVDGSGDYVTGADGTVCVAGLTIGSHTVLETAAPNGHTLDPTNPRSVSVSAAATCSSGTPATVTFNDPLVLGTINIHKTKIDGTPLGGATFTLYVNNAPLGSPRGNEDTITTKACTTNASGDCTITNVDLGDYWAVETTTPNGFITAADKAVTVSVGTLPGTGDTDALTFVDPVAPGQIVIHKVGSDGADLAGATFVLYVNNAPLGGPRGLEDTVTTKTCATPTDDNGDCTINAVTPGDYWIVETTTPAGYDTAADTAVTVPLGNQANQGASVPVTITDPVVPGTINIHKTGIGGSALAGATFTLYVNNSPKASPRGAEDTITTKTCTTAVSGDCAITNVALGDYWVVETTTPAGYDTAAEQADTVGHGTSAHVGDTDSLEFADPVVPGTVNITKKDDANNPLSGAEFTLYNNASPFGAPRDGAAIDTITSPAQKCTTGAGGTCSITGVAPGRYWVVETGTPDHYDTADDAAITVGLGSAAHQGDTVPVSLVDPRQHRVVVLVCHEGTDTLFSRDVTVNGVTKQSLDAGSLTNAQQKALCDAGGASFGDISGHPDVNALVELSKVNGGS